MRSTTGTPMLPPTRDGMPASARIAPASVVVVVLPFEPVMARILPLRNCAASSSSPMTGSPKLLACTSSGVSSGTPGLTTIRSCRRKVSSPWPPASTAMPCSIRAGISLLSISALRMSETVTCAPRRRRKRAAANPDLPRPTTRTFLPLSSMVIPNAGMRARTRSFSHARLGLAKFQCRQCKECKYQGGDPEAHDHLGLGPADQLEMMMQRRHFEDALLTKFVTADLQNDRQRFQNKDAADEGEQQLLLDDDGH